MEGVTCNLCLKSFATKGNLNRHIRSFHQINTWDCNICKKNFGEKQNLLRHKRNMHANQISKKYKQLFTYDKPKRREIDYEDVSESSNNEEIENFESDSAYSKNNEKDDSENSEYSYSEEEDSENNYHSNGEEEEEDNFVNSDYSNSEEEEFDNSENRCCSWRSNDGDEEGDEECGEQEIRKLKLKAVVTVLHTITDI